MKIILKLIATLTISSPHNYNSINTFLIQLVLKQPLPCRKSFYFLLAPYFEICQTLEHLTMFKCLVSSHALTTKSPAYSLIQIFGFDWRQQQKADKWTRKIAFSYIVKIRDQSSTTRYHSSHVATWENIWNSKNLHSGLSHDNKNVIRVVWNSRNFASCKQKHSNNRKWKVSQVNHSGVSLDLTVALSKSEKKWRGTANAIFLFS